MKTVLIGSAGRAWRCPRPAFADRFRPCDSLRSTPIGRALLSKPRLTGAEIRFLRKELGCSQKGLAEIIGASEQTVSLWARNRGQIQPAADRILRLFYAEHVQGNVQVRKFIEQRAEAERERQPRARKLMLEKGRTHFSATG
jgi:transcriptional regulator with XRE-family HTH domain